MGYIGEKARGERLPAKELLLDKFGDTIVAGGVSAQYVRFGKSPVVIGVSGLKFDSMAVNILASDDVIFEQFTSLINEGYSILIVRNENDFRAFTEKDGNLAEAKLGETVLNRCAELIRSTDTWGGKLATNGELTFDPSTPSPGPHYYTNMLIDRLRLPAAVDSEEHSRQLRRRFIQITCRHTGPRNQMGLSA